MTDGRNGFVRTIKGFYGQLRPLQVTGGKCVVCGRTGYVDLHEETNARPGDRYIHHACIVTIP
jgi:hypothetical protein